MGAGGGTGGEWGQVGAAHSSRWPPHQGRHSTTMGRGGRRYWRGGLHLESSGLTEEPGGQPRQPWQPKASTPKKMQAPVEGGSSRPACTYSNPHPSKPTSASFTARRMGSPRRWSAAAVAAARAACAVERRMRVHTHSSEEGAVLPCLPFGQDTSTGRDSGGGICAARCAACIIAAPLPSLRSHAMAKACSQSSQWGCEQGCRHRRPGADDGKPGKAGPASAHLVVRGVDLRRRAAQLVHLLLAAQVLPSARGQPPTYLACA